MPFCPNCGTEYRPEYNYCSDCGAALVSNLPEGAEMTGTEDEVQLVKLTEFITPMEADMIKELLEENGIPSLVRGHSDPLGVVSGAQPVALLVAEPDLKRALEIYEAFFEQSGEEGEENSTSEE